MEIKKPNPAGHGFVIWFPFVRSHMKMIREGSLVAVKNFSSSDEYNHYSVMRITTVMPTHYALMTSGDGYPGFVEEAALSASKDWDQDRPIEDTTKIRCDAVPSRFEIKIPLSMENGDSKIEPETNLPMPGERVKLLDTEWTGRIINHDLQTKEGTVVIGTLANMSDVEILALWDSMIRTHFGVFAYTNAGKSNLLSTITSKIFQGSNSVNAVIYDLMGEYGILLSDVLYNNDKAYIIFVSQGDKHLHNFWKSPTEENAETAANTIVKTTVFPKMLVDRKKEFIRPVQKMLMDGKFKILSYEYTTIGHLLYSLMNSAGGTAGEQEILLILKTAEDAPNNIENLRNLENELNSHDFVAKSVQKGKNLKYSALDMLKRAIQNLEEADSIDAKYKISLGDMIKNLNQDSSRSLYIIQGYNDKSIREFSHELGDKMLYSRREQGIISPPTSFIFDEADQFIAQGDESQSGMNKSKQTAEQLARRGRKYGLGIGIATQRIVYLDTNILGQPHTYFVSKLPRASDREKIQEAFGLSDEVLQESLRFAVGQWLLISHGSTGIDGLPIPVQLPDANERIKDFLDKLSDAGNGQ